jgi:hypothetical protein
MLLYSGLAAMGAAGIAEVKAGFAPLAPHKADRVTHTTSRRIPGASQT